MSHLDKYASEARGVADEIVHLIKTFDGFLAFCEHRVAKRGVDHFLQMDEDQLKAARSFLKKTPSQRLAVEKKLYSPKEDVKYSAVDMIIRARILGLMGANALEMASSFDMIPGSSYRSAVEYAGSSALRNRLVPDPDEVFSTRF
jgi:hypothetical protein